MREGQASARLGLTLGLLSTVGPLSIDLCLPALPAMMRDLNAAPGELQRALSIFFFALAAAQIPLGSLSDRLGRKPVIFVGFALFMLACFACAASTSVESLVASRFVQGFGVCAGTSARALGTVQLAVTAAASGAISLFPAFSVVPLLAILGISFLGAFLLSGERRGEACRIESYHRA